MPICLTILTYVIQRMLEDGQLIKSGSTRSSRYYDATRENIEKIKSLVVEYSRFLKTKDLEEDKVLEDIKKKTNLFGANQNSAAIFDYSFTEILNNAIEHSGSASVHVQAAQKGGKLLFEINDRGIGIFNNIQEKFNFDSEDDAIGLLLKGKLTTAISGHTGEGIFFTSKVADTLIIQSGIKKIIFNNLMDDVFVRSVRNTSGTKVRFTVSLESSKDIAAVFNKYMALDYSFDTTRVLIKLYAGSTSYVSRSEARRVLAGTDKFKKIILNFKGIESIGQGFADEVFRVWKNAHPQAEIEFENAGPDVLFMINHVLRPN